MKMSKLRQGFTVIEILTVIGILSIVLSGIAAFMIYAFQSYSFSFAEYGAVELARSSVTRINRDIREIRTGETGGWPIINASDNSFSFYSDVTNDGKADRVRYFLDGTSLKRGVIEASGSPLSYPAASEKISYAATGVYNGTNPVFRYYNGNWPSDTANNPLPAALRITATRYVTVYLNIKTNPSSTTGAFELTTGIQIRSMKDNL
jgi:prepilin-type N-terminal cleavage/methylation domain-containing protein